MAQTGKEKRVRSERTSAPKVLRARSTRAAAQETPAVDEVARRAYEHFVARGYQHGHDVEDWLRAESELRGTR
jgi:hypothetical protein